MRLVLFETTERPEVRPGLFTERGVVSIAETVPAGATPQATMVNIIDGFEGLRPALEPGGPTIPLAEILQRLATRLDLPLTGGTPEEVWTEVARSVPAYSGMTYETIGELGEAAAEPAVA